MESKRFTPLYPYSFGEAERLGELDQWKESHQANIACRNAIEEAIRQNFDGMYLNAGCAGAVIEQFGYRRTAFVLANSLQHKPHDGRFSRDNLAWAKRFHIPSKAEGCADYSHQFAVDSHPAVLDGFLNQYRRAYQALDLFDHTHCLPDTETQDFEGKVIVLSPQVLSEQYFTPENQLWLCTGGFGARAGARGRAVYATCLADGETARLDREDFSGVLEECHLPGWAREKLAELREQRQGGTPAPGVGGMTMQ